jgi:quinate dehydrogenase (quinone)
VDVPHRPPGKRPGIGVDENTPLQIGDTLYSCTPLNVVTALDADTGKARWRFDPHADRRTRHLPRRRLLRCTKRYSLTRRRKPARRCSSARSVFWSTVDARLIALNAKTGELCDNFGDHGSVDLKQGWTIPKTASATTRPRRR